MELTIVASKDFEENGKRKSAGKQRQVGAGDNAAFRGYINLNLNEAEKAAYEAWVGAETVIGVFDVVVCDGVNVSTKPDPKGDGYLASATQRRESSVNAGLVVTARGKNPVVAFNRLMYCLAILARSESWEATQPMADPDRW